MKHILSIIISIIFIQCTYGQIATIKDADGWTNVRKEANAQSDIIHKLYENEVFWYDLDGSEKDPDWVKVYIPKNEFSFGSCETSDIVGFIHKSRLLPLTSLKKYVGNDFVFKYKLADFDPTNRIVDEQEEQEEKWLTAIDGLAIWGTDGIFPRTMIADITVQIEGQNIDIHKVFYSDIYECDNTFSIYKNGAYYFVHQSNSDGAAYYEIVWVLSEKGLKQRLVGSWF